MSSQIWYEIGGENKLELVKIKGEGEMTFKKTANISKKIGNFAITCRRQSETVSAARDEEKVLYHYLQLFTAEIFE